MPERDSTTGKYVNAVRDAQGKDTGDFKDFSDYGTQTSKRAAARNWGGANRMLQRGEDKLTDEELFGD